MTTHVLGLDIGGANLKAAHNNRTARSVGFPLWKHPERLTAELIRLCAAMPAFDCMAITMTGELCDCFRTKREGAQAILQSAQSAAGERPIRVWSIISRFLDVETAMENLSQVAAANWLALAHLVAEMFRQERVLLIDTGSTTTDIVYLVHGKPAPRGLTDSQRLATGELVYTGVRRTPICAVLGMAVAAEFFATMQDAYLCAGLIPGRPDDWDTADGRPATRIEARFRLARMLCADAESFFEQQAIELANRALQTQWHVVGQAVERVIAQRPIDRVVLSGSGEIVGRSVCTQLPALCTLPVTSLSEALGAELSEAACAYAVAMLATKERGNG